MKRFVINIVLFSLLFVGCLAIGEVIARQRPTYHGQKEAMLLARAHNIHTLIIGNSHNMFSLDPSCMPGAEAFNVACLGQPINYDLIVYQTYRPYLDNLKRVIINCDYFSFFDHPFESYGYKIASNYISPYLLHTKVPICGDGFSIYGFEIGNPPRFRSKLVPWIKSEDMTISPDSNGYVFPDKEPMKEKYIDVAVAEAVERHVNHNPYMQPVIIRSLVELDSLCRNDGIELVLVATPVIPEYCERFDQQQIARHYEILDSLKQVCSFRYLDYTADKRFVLKDFFDADHLMGEASQRFSRILWNDIQQGKHSAVSDE